MHGVFVVYLAGVTFRRVKALRPVILLYIGPAKLRNVLGQPDAKHLRILGHCVPDTFPPHEVKILFQYDVLAAE
jgi:hypothetical protein